MQDSPYETWNLKNATLMRKPARRVPQKAVVGVGLALAFGVAAAALVAPGMRQGASSYTGEGGRYAPPAAPTPPAFAATPQAIIPPAPLRMAYLPDNKPGLELVPPERKSLAVPVPLGPPLAPAKELPEVARPIITPAGAGSICRAAWVDATKYSTYLVRVAADGRETVLADVGSKLHRHPASVTKVMTLAIVFDELESGRLKLSDRVTMSANAIGQEPTSLWRERAMLGTSTFTVEAMIHAIAIRSANDAAVAMAEHISGSVPEFAKRMTAKARAIGMANTNYANPSGLPDWRNYTTARDQVTLMRHLQEKYQKYTRYLGVTKYRIGTLANGKPVLINTHNRVLGNSIAGWQVDGAKTGYIGVSKFNMTFTASHSGERAYGIVFGTSRWANMMSCVRSTLGTLSRPLLNVSRGAVTSHSRAQGLRR